MNTLLSACIAAALALAPGAWARADQPSVAPITTAADATASPNGKKEADKRPKPKPSKKSRKPAPRSGNS